jgi:hypothetical protein
VLSRALAKYLNGRELHPPPGCRRRGETGPKQPT